MQATNTKELRVVLLDEINKIRNGETTPDNVNAISRATGKILSSVRLELEYNKILGIRPDIDFIHKKG